MAIDESIFQRALKCLSVTERDHLGLQVKNGQILSKIVKKNEYLPKKRVKNKKESQNN